MKELPIYKIEATNKLNEFDRLEIKDRLAEDLNDKLGSYIWNYHCDSGRTFVDLERQFKDLWIDDFDLTNKGFDLTSCQEDEPEQYDFEKSLIMEWAKN